MLLANVYSCLAAFHGGISDPVNCTSVAIASIGKQLHRMPHAVRESFASGGMNFCLVPSVRGVSDASDTGPFLHLPHFSLIHCRSHQLQWM